jgi:hypothetical protein
MTRHQTCNSKLRTQICGIGRGCLISLKNNCSPKEPYYLAVLYKCNLTQEELDEEYMGLYALGQMMHDPLYDQISYNISLSNAFKLKLGHNVNLFLPEMKAATGKENAEHVMRLAEVIPASLVPVKYAHC